MVNPDATNASSDSDSCGFSPELAKLQKLTSPFEDFPLSLSLQPLQSRVFAVERVLLHSIAQIPNVASQPSVQLSVARNIARSTRRLVGPVKEGWEGMRHANGNLANLVEGIDIVNRKLNYASRTHKSKSREELVVTFDEYNCR